MFERQKVPIFGFCFHLISKTIEILIVDSYEFERKKNKQEMTQLYITPSFSTSTVQYYMQMPIKTFGAYRVCRSIDIYSTVQTYGTGIRYVQTNDAYICVQITEPIYPTEI